MESVDQLLKRITSLGIKRDYLERLVPGWVIDYPPVDDAGHLELKIQLARDLGLDLKSLEVGQKPAFGALPSAPKFKRTQGVTPSKLKPAASMFYSLARALSASCKVDYQALPNDAATIRAEILAFRKTVDLPGLLDYLWAHGIPVAHYSDWPEKIMRPKAMAVDVDGRPVIIVGSARMENGWHAFFVAHEAGHIASGHLGRDELIVDGEGDDSNDIDPQEIEADRFALNLLGGNASIEMPAVIRKSSEFDQSVKNLGQVQKIDQGHLLLRFAMASGRWDLATAALQRVEASADAPRFINRDRAADALDWDQLSTERQAFVRRALALQ